MDTIKIMLEIQLLGVKKAQEKLDDLKKNIRFELAGQTKTLNGLTPEQALRNYLLGNYDMDIIGVIHRSKRIPDCQAEIDAIKALYKDIFNEEYIFDEKDLNFHKSNNCDGHNYMIR